MPSILLVEDDLDLAKADHRVLRSAGYDVVHARDGRTALSSLALMEEPPAVILLDLEMPVMSGWDVIAALRADARFSAIPVIVVSANADDRLIGTHAVMKVAKPYTMENLLDAISACVTG